MAKRASPGEKPFRPLNPELVSEALSKPTLTTAPAPEAEAPSVSARVVEMPELTRRDGDAAAKPRFASIAESRLQTSSEPTAAAQPLVEKFNSEKRILFTRPETQAIDRLVHTLASRLNCQLKVSHVFRGLTALLLNAEAELDKRAGEHGPIVRPPNGDAQGLQRFEREIGRIIAGAIRDARPLS